MRYLLALMFLGCYGMESSKDGSDLNTKDLASNDLDVGSNHGGGGGHTPSMKELKCGFVKDPCDPLQMPDPNQPKINPVRE